MKPTRDGFGEALLELGKENSRIVVLSADLTSSTRAGWFKEKFPERFFSFGVAEQDMFTAAAGFSLSGKIAFACTFGVFAAGRAWDQLRLSVCYMNLDVKIAGTHGGISVGADGATHQALEEITIMRTLPNMTVLVPADAIEAKKATLQASYWKGPVYMRLGRNPVPIVTKEDDFFKIGKANILKTGNDATIIACGVMVYEALMAEKLLKKEGYNVGVINLHTIKPIDKKTILQQAARTGAIVTAEEHTVVGGMGSAVAEVLSKENPVPMEFIGINDRFGESGAPVELMESFGLTVPYIATAVKRVARRKKTR